MKLSVSHVAHLVVLSLLVLLVGSHTLGGFNRPEMLKRRTIHPIQSKSKEPEASVCDTSIKQGGHCGQRPLCCRSSSCQMFNTLWRTFVDCPAGAKHEDCICIDESLVSRTKFEDWESPEPK